MMRTPMASMTSWLAERAELSSATAPSTLPLGPPGPCTALDRG